MKYLSFLINIIFYFIGIAGLFAFVLWVGNLLPLTPFDRPAQTGVVQALLINTGLIVLFGLQHTIMARQGFKDAWTKIIPKQLERSTYVVISGLLCFLIIWAWAPIDGILWDVSESVGFYIFYGLFFFGVLFLLSSSFLINHFELFGLKQGYDHMTNKEVSPPKFREIAYYKIIRHPIYLGFLLIIWSTPVMSVSHLCLAVLFTLYIYIGVYFEEADLQKVFGNVYRDYKNRVPKVIPFTKW